jgi:hypothetical protein
MATRRTSRNENKENNVTTQTDTPNFGDVDVDAPAPVAEDTVAPTTTEDKPAAKAKESTRPPVPEGKVSPVHFAKLLSEHLRQDHPELGVRLGSDSTVAPQVVYSYIKNNGPESKNPFPAEKTEGRAAVIDPEAGFAWWDAKDLRVKAQKAGAAEKAAKKAEKAKSGSEDNKGAATEPQPALVEAE